MELELPDYWVGCCAGLGQGDIKRTTLAEHWGHRGGGGTPSDLKSRDKLLSRWKPLLTPVPKAIPIPSSHFQTLSLTISPLSPVSQPKKTHRNQQLRAPARNSSSPAKKPLATAGSHGTASSLAGTLNASNSPSPQLRVPGGDKEMLFRDPNCDHRLSVRSHGCSEDLASQCAAIIGFPNEICVCSQSCCGRVPSRPGMSQSCRNALLSPLA